MSELEGRVEEIENGTVGFMDVNDLEARLSDVEATVSAICDSLSYYNGALYDIYANAC